MIDSAKVKLLVAPCELTIGEQECRIVGNGLVEQTDCVPGLLYPASIEGTHFK